MGEKEEKPASGPSQLENKIIRQIEYYFGDNNLRRDKFLQEKINEDEGWVSLECLVTFNRLKALSSDFSVIMNALKKSETGLLELNEEKNCIRRSKEKPMPGRLDPEMMKTSKEKTIYLKGFPTDYTLDNIEEFLEGKGKTIFVKMIRTIEEKSFKGAIFVEFETPEMAKEFLARTDLKIGDTELEVMPRDDFYKTKDGEKKPKKSSRRAEEEELDMKHEKGAVLHFKGVGEETSREDLREIFGQHEEISWVDFSKDAVEGHIRFKNEGAAQKAIDAVESANDGKVIINGVTSLVRVLEGEEEENFWKAAKKADRDRFKQRQQKRHSAGGHNRKNRQSDWKRPRRQNNGEKPSQTSTEKPDHKRFDDDNDGGAETSEEPKAKQAKVE